MKAVFFDAGGTLIHIDHRRLAEVVRVLTGRAVAPEDLLAAEYAGRAAVEEAMALGETGSDTSRWRVHFRGMLEALDLGAGAYDLLSPAIIAEHRRRHLWTSTIPGTAEALEALGRAGYLVACISNADGTVASLLEGAGLAPHLRFVVDSGLVGVEKPDPRIFAIALEQAGVAAAESYYVGDIYPVDVVGARNAGLVPVLLDPLGRYGERDCRTAPDVPTFCRALVSAARAA